MFSNFTFWGFQPQIRRKESFRCAKAMVIIVRGEIEKPEKRMADHYEITDGFRIGDKEVVFGVDEKSEQSYFCALAVRENLILYTQDRFEDCMVGNDYIGMMELFADRIREQCTKVRAEWEKVTVPREMFTQEDCFPNDYTQAIEGKIVAVKPNVLRPEYRSADHQLVYVTGGSGSLESPHGTTCYGKNLYTGNDVTWKRHEFLGEVKPEHLPAWAKEKAIELVQNRQERKQNRKRSNEMEL